jgi:predicted nucleic acid-binding protein
LDKASTIEVVLDTNVLVAAFRSSLGASYRLLQTLEERRWRPVISPTLAFEYEAVLKRGAPETGLTLQDIDDFIEYLCSRSRLVQIYFRWRPALRDPDDDRIWKRRSECSRQLSRSMPGILPEPSDLGFE